MNLSDVLVAVAILSVLGGTASAVMITAALQRRGIKINWVFLRVLFLTRYLGQYREVTRQETGRTGPLFYSYIISMNVALVTAVFGLLLRAA